MFLSRSQKDDEEYLSVSGNHIKEMDLSEEFLYSFIPKDFVFYIKPFYHQLLSYVFALQFDRGVGYFFRMGLGKTKAAIDLLRLKGIESNILVVTVGAALINWEREFFKNAGDEYRIKVLRGSSKQKNEDLLSDEDVFIVNFEGLYRQPKRLKGLNKNEKQVMKKRMNIGDYILPNLERDWDCIIIDESRLIKNPNAIRTQVCMALAYHASDSMILTGLPIAKAKQPDEICSQYYCIDYGEQFGDINNFRRNYLMKVEDDKGNPQIVLRDGAEIEINERMYHQAIRFAKDECADLPPVSFVPRYVYLEGDQLECYEKMKREKRYTVVTKKNIMFLKAALARFLQVCGGWLKANDKETFQFKTNVKMRELDYLLNEELLEEQVVIKAFFVAEQKGIYDHLVKSGFRTGRIASGMKPDEIQYVIDEFDKGNFQHVVLSPKVGGKAINLTTCAYPIDYSRDPDFDTYEQVNDRFHRIGQKRKVTYTSLICQGTYDERVLEILKEDKRITDVLVDGVSLEELL